MKNYLSLVLCGAGGLLAIAAGIAGSDARSGPSTCPATSAASRPADVLDAFPDLKREHTDRLARMDEWLDSLEPEAFGRAYGRLAEQTRSDDVERRVRAIHAVAVLGEPGGIPHLVRACRQEQREVRRAAFSCLAGWVYGEYWAAGRRVPRDLMPLMPLFVEELFRCGDDLPNIRCACFQALGCLADKDWLPLLIELRASRHGAAEHWSSWCIKEIMKRTEEPEAAETQPAPPPKVDGPVLRNEAP